MAGGDSIVGRIGTVPLAGGGFPSDGVAGLWAEMPATLGQSGAVPTDNIVIHDPANGDTIVIAPGTQTKISGSTGAVTVTPAGPGVWTQ